MALKVVFVQYGRDISCATMMVASCKRLGYEVIQLSDEVAPMVPQADAMIVAPMGERRMLWRAQRLLDVEPPFVMLDTDMLVVRDISDGFGGDVGLTWRYPNRVITQSGEAIRMPYNGGVIFATSRAFLEDVADRMTKMPAEHQDWYGDQIALRDAAESGKYTVHTLKDPVWNFSPDYLDHEIPGVRIFHFKGRRKFRMPAYYERLIEVEA